MCNKHSVMRKCRYAVLVSFKLVLSGLDPEEVVIKASDRHHCFSGFFSHFMALYTLARVAHRGPNHGHEAPICGHAA